jgi:hypothetical protein
MGRTKNRSNWKISVPYKSGCTSFKLNQISYRLFSAFRWPLHNSR